MKSNLKKNKGITLIALVITIIVLLILAGVSISMLAGENGILRQATRAKEETEKESLKEQIALDIIAEQLNGDGNITDKKLEQLLGKYGTVTKDGEGNITGVDNKKVGNIPLKDVFDGTIEKEKTLADLRGKGHEATKKETITDENGDQVVIPKGFYVSNDSADTVKEGIVVVAPDESEFVWVPVPDITKMYGTSEDGKKLGKLYTFTGTTEHNALNWTEEDGKIQWTATSYGESYREPAYLEDSKADQIPHNGVYITQDSLQSEFNEMIKYVEQAKGFYIGRYETSLDKDNGDKAQSKKEKESMTAEDSKYGTWYGLYQKEKEYAEKNSLTEVVGSSMIWGSQYDQMMIWMQGNNINVSSATPIVGVTANINSTTTGIEDDEDILNNVYDLLGCHYEWTLEAVSRDLRVYRRR